VGTAENRGTADIAETQGTPEIQVILVKLAIAGTVGTQVLAVIPDTAEVEEKMRISWRSWDDNFKQ
jgi:hypothetical protein